ncbi:SGNH/GDSL hydrolase family protein [Bifidobacterium callimiconis]|uniref:SGNH/GDSL hydrolase family protein n=1 Tax=Bifidobacterium callimiconis TaxID=2306973 RepID=UPI001BDD125C|nr:SGNH/GDSL hydrolase family protein [Bifidobacterium callimiconis]MBT1176790.1 SGNH/GDSL hydrolase family protein [Bifidobacterium callimiconis]
MNLARKTRVLAEAWWAKHHVHLAEEPAGERSGVVGPMAAERSPLNLVAVGDSMVAGCGVDDQKDGLIPDIARGIADTLNRQVQWRTYGKLGATMRRVRYRLLPEVDDTPDLLIVCAGSNDIMAQRSVSEWKADLAAVLDEALPLTDNIVVFSSGQLYNSPSLGPALREFLEGRIDAQTRASREICAERGVFFLDMTHENVRADTDEFYASDHFHPGAFGYRYMADRTVELLDDYLKRFR